MNHPDKPSNPGVTYREVDADTAGQRLDNFLIAHLKGVPRTLVYRLIRSGQVRVNSGRSQAGYRVQAGDRIRVPPVAQRQPAAVVVPREGLGWLAERIIHEDGRLLVLDKPAGLAVHGGSSINLGAIEALRVLRPDLAGAELVHRLDRATSGCLLIAKRRPALRELHVLLREGTVDKRYLALVRGVWPQRRREVDAPLLTRRNAAGETRVVVDDTGKTALSRFEVLETFGDLATLVRVSLPTGRMHQIRVHAAHVGHPVAGDTRYGDHDWNARLIRLGLNRMFLHASAVSFRWPESGEQFAIGAPLPRELLQLLDRLRGPRAGAVST